MIRMRGNNGKRIIDLTKDELDDINNLTTKHHSLINTEIYKINGFTKTENYKECTLYFEIEYVYKNQSINSSEDRYLKFIYESECGEIPLSGTYDELINKFAKSEK